ncbi:MAG: hemerythrin domain-containing protein [Armatimonadota bacterium]
MDESIGDGERTAIDYIHFIISTHHQFLRRESPQLRKALTELPDTSEARRCSMNLEVLLNDIDQHLMKEERILFPTIEEIELSLIQGRDTQITACGVIGPINQMVFEHDQVKELLRSLDNDCSKIGNDEISRSISILKLDLLEHIRIEEEELFPLARRLCPSMAA